MAQFGSLFGSLLAFAGPARPYPIANANDITAAAWQQTGQSLQQAMDAVEGGSGQHSPDSRISSSTAAE